MALTGPPLVMFLGLGLPPRPLACVEAGPCLQSERDISNFPGGASGHQTPHRVTARFRVSSVSLTRWPMLVSISENVSMSFHIDQPRKTIARPLTLSQLSSPVRVCPSLVVIETLVCLSTCKCPARRQRIPCMAVSPIRREWICVCLLGSTRTSQPGR